ncbi:MAG: ABC transporter substrate-binding protein, partial [Veillonella sp.]|nr:ABC transporter substrate-binding protein [Veillonella sp.]
PVKGTDVQMEEIQKLKPQVVLASNKNQIEMARNAGIPAVRVNFQDYDGLRKVINITAEVLGDKAPEMAKQYLAYLDGKIKFAEDRTKSIDDANRPSVMEEIVKANPDIIIIGGTQSRKGIEAIKNDPQWASLKAVQNGRIYSNPVGTFNWDRYSAESALQILWAGQIIQPQLFNDIDLVKETKLFYKTFLRYDLSDAEAQRIIAGEGPQ